MTSTHRGEVQRRPLLCACGFERRSPLDKQPDNLGLVVGGRSMNRKPSILVWLNHGNPGGVHLAHAVNLACDNSEHEFA
jgi:hypothetical protein